MQRDEVESAAKSFLESEIERRGLTNLPDGLVLRPSKMDSVLKCSGCAPRFKR
jgi:hypothetical protein